MSRATIAMHTSCLSWMSLDPRDSYVVVAAHTSGGGGQLSFVGYGVPRRSALGCDTVARLPRDGCHSMSAHLGAPGSTPLAPTDRRASTTAPQNLGTVAAMRSRATADVARAPRWTSSHVHRGGA
jgi:hypothetical protein